MGIRFSAARAVSAVSTWGLKNVFRRPAANFPGKVALYVDPQLIAHLRGKLRRGSICVVGTNGKTTVTNLLADVMETSGASVVCNRTGANLDSGVSTALLHAKDADWGVFESDELWLAKILPQLQSNYVLLLNLFRDQLDRCGEIDRIQDSIVRALGSSPNTVLVYNADDPLCASIADRASQLPGRENTRSIAFGVKDSMGLAQNTVTDATMCQRCSTMFEYDWRQYGQLGEWKCPNCGFARPALDFAAENVALGAEGLSFELRNGEGATNTDQLLPIRASFSGAYMVYNLAAVGVAATLLGADAASLQAAINAFDPRNGRLQEYHFAGRKVLLNLAKNPTGFNQNLKIVAQDPALKVVAFFINDKEADGHDVSWLWDIDFEELAQVGPMIAFAGGIRKHDMQVRLKYAGIKADVVDDPEQLLRIIDEQPAQVSAYLIANYTSLPVVKAALDAKEKGLVEATEGELAQGPFAHGPHDGLNLVDDNTKSSPVAEFAQTPEASCPKESNLGTDESSLSHLAKEKSPIVIAHLFPDLLNLYGDGGNVRVLEQRLRWRNIPVEVKRVCHGDAIDLSQVDLVMMGGSPDREQKLASADVVAMRDELLNYVEDDGPLLAICGSYQMLGREWLVDGEKVPGLGLVGMTTGRPGTSADRLVNNIILRSPLAEHPVVGYENHAGRTYLDAGVESFGSVLGGVGLGNNEETHADGVRYKNLIGTYLHGPLLAKNPEIADWLLSRALERHTARTDDSTNRDDHTNHGEDTATLAALDDSEEISANAFMCNRLGVK